MFQHVGLSSYFNLFLAVVLTILLSGVLKMPFWSGLVCTILSVVTIWASSIGMLHYFSKSNGA